MASIQVARLTAAVFPELTGEVVSMSINDAVGFALIKILGLPEDGTAVQIRTGFMCYDKSHQMLFIAHRKSDLPVFAEKRRQSID